MRGARYVRLIPHGPSEVVANTYIWFVGSRRNIEKTEIPQPGARDLLLICKCTYNVFCIIPFRASQIWNLYVPIFGDVEAGTFVFSVVVGMFIFLCMFHIAACRIWTVYLLCRFHFEVCNCRIVSLSRHVSYGGMCGNLYFYFYVPFRSM